MNYSVAIRTLGKAGEYYQKTLDSIKEQAIQPDKIIIYLADGYDIPRETIGVEQYVYVKKGMVAQRALPYSEIDSEYILFLDDDVYLPEKAVEILYSELKAYSGDVISPCTFENHKVPLKTKIRLTLSGKEACRPFGKRWGYKVLRTAGFSYNNNPVKPVYQSQTNAGPCFFCKKEDFLSIKYEEEMWLDETPYALPDDQVMFYKMHLSGLKVLTSFDSRIVHLDAGSTIQGTPERENKIIYSGARNRLIFWHRFIYSKAGVIGKAIAVLSIAYAYLFQLIKYAISDSDKKEAFLSGYNDGKKYIKSIR